MVIQTLDTSYTVVKRCGAEEGTERFICRDGDKSGLVTLLRTKDRQVIAGAMDYISREVAPETFTDFKGCFVSGEYFCVAMAYHGGAALRHRLERENSTLKERLQVGLQLLEKAILLKLPWYFFCDAADQDQIAVSPSLEVEFNYRLRDLGNCGQYGRQQACKRLSVLLQRLFEQEFRRRVLPEMQEFCGELEQGEELFEDYMDIYRRYRELAQRFSSLPPDDLKSPRTWPFRLWERIKAAAAAAKKLAAALLLAAAVIYLIFTVRQAGLPGESREVFRYIGTLEIGE